MKLQWFLLLAVTVNVRTPMNQRQWIKFVETLVPQYEVNETETIQPEIILAEYIDVRKPLAKLSQMV